MKRLSCLCVAAALGFLTGPALAQHAGGAMLSGGAHGGHSAPAGGFGHFGRGFHQPDWFSGGWPDRPQTFSPTGFRDRRGSGHGNGHHSSRWDGWNHAYPAFWGYGSWGENDGYVFTEPSADMFGFYGAGGDVDVLNGSAVYQYDRSYPYDWYRGGPAETVRVHRAAETRCEMQVVPDGKGKGKASVRICRR
jgi:hypothetical protein